MRILLASFLVLGACGPSGRDNDGTGDDDPVNDAGDPGSDTPATDGPSLVYAHSSDTLYRVDSTTLNAQVIGTMGGLNGSLLDLAVNSVDNIIGATGSALYSIDASTGTASHLANVSGAAQGMSSLSYVPLPSGEILISANNAGNVYQINVSGSSATATMIGQYGLYNGEQITSSGDIFGVAGFGIYATVNIAGEDNDYLAKLNPNNNWKAEIIGPVGYDQVFGLGFWAGKIYGFIDDNGGGRMIEINPTTGAGTQLLSNNVRWYGAGVTTDAPIIQ